jgi:hypothetical protein
MPFLGHGLSFCYLAFIFLYLFFHNYIHFTYINYTYFFYIIFCPYKIIILLSFCYHQWYKLGARIFFKKKLCSKNLHYFFGIYSILVINTFFANFIFHFLKMDIFTFFKNVQNQNSPPFYFPLF